jgi:hypothetical protein
MLCANPIQTEVVKLQVQPPRQDRRHKADIRAYSAHGYFAELCGPESPARAEVEAFIRTVFQRAHGANIRHFMPQLMSLRDAEGRLVAVCGLRNAADGPLFLETYLDAPVERVIAQRTGADVAREDIVEIGNLAVAEPGIAPGLLASVSMYLHGTDTQWAVFTAIPLLKNSLTRLNMPLETLGQAELACIPPEERADWGSYYDKNPHVMAVRRAARPEQPQRSLLV